MLQWACREDRIVEWRLDARPVTMPIANDKRRRPERTEAIRILKPAISNIQECLRDGSCHANDTVDDWGRETSPRPCTHEIAKFPQDTFFAHMPHKPKRSAIRRIERKLLAQPCERRTISVPFSQSCAAFEFNVPPRKEYCFILCKMVSSQKFNASRPKLVNGSENRCSFIFDKKYDELRWFVLLALRLTV